MFCLLFGECDDEGRAVTVLALCHDIAVMATSYFPAHTQPYARSLIFGAGVQPLERAENLVGELLIKADPVVLIADFPDPRTGWHLGQFPMQIFVAAPGNGHFRSDARLLELQRVRD